MSHLTHGYLCFSGWTDLKDNIPTAIEDRLDDNCPESKLTDTLVFALNVTSLIDP